MDNSWEDSARIMGGKSKLGRRDPSAIRLRQLREALGYPTASAFTVRLGLDAKSTRWINVEGGYRISMDLVILVVQKFPGMTSDYLIFGNPAGLNDLWLRRLGLLPPPSQG